MRKNFLIAFSILSITAFAVTICFADNPIVQTNFTADPAPLVYNDTFYVFTGHDEDSAGGWFYMIDWRCYASTDMANWTDLGSPMSLKTFSWSNVDAWASQCIYRNGKFYWYVCIRLSGDNFGIGVGVATKPEGPYTDAIGKPLVTGNGYIDPGVYIDDDDQAYLYWGNPGLWYAKLNADMISLSGNVVQVTQNAQTVGNQYAEAPWLYKRNNLYYLIFAGDGTPGVEDICYSTGPSATGPWTFRGRIMAPTGCWTIHPGITDYKGNSYFVYHNAALPGAGTGGFRRSVCIEKFNYNADGTIPLIPMTTSGPPQIGTLNPYVQTEAETICWETGVETEKCSEGGMDVCSIENGDYIKVKGVNFSTGASSFEARVASGTSGGNIEIRLDSTTGTLVGTCAVIGTGGWQTWETRTCAVSGATGIHDLYFRFTGGSGSLLNFNWWRFIGGPTPTPTPTPTPSPTPTPLQNPIWTGGPYTLNGTTDYVDVPDGITGNLSDFSVACWVKLSTVTNWVRIFDFGGDSNIFMMLTPASANTGFPYFAITTTGNPGEQGLNGTEALPLGSWQHLAVVKSGNTGILYINKQEVSRNTAMSLRPADLGSTVNNYIGRSQWSHDPYLDGSIDQFRIYNRALSSLEVAALPSVGGVTGDVNGDGTVTIVDAMLISQYVSGLPLAVFINANADANCDSVVNINDALLAARYAAGLVTKLGC